MSMAQRRRIIENFFLNLNKILGIQYDENLKFENREVFLDQKLINKELKCFDEALFKKIFKLFRMKLSSFLSEIYVPQLSKCEV